MKNKLVFVFLTIVLAFGFVLSGCATQAPAAAAPADDEVPKTLIITGFDLPADGIREFQVKLTKEATWSDVPDGGDWTVLVVCDNAQPDGQTRTAELYVRVDGGTGWTRWTGTGKYGVNITLCPNPKGSTTAKTYRYKTDMPDEAVAFTDAETTLAWSDFEYDWEFTEE